MAKNGESNQKNKAGPAAKPARKTSRKKASKAVSRSVAEVVDEIRQQTFPPEIRIERPTAAGKPRRSPAGASRRKAKVVEAPAVASLFETSPEALAEMATFLWYVRTRHMRREWRDEDTVDEDPRVRRTLGRLNRCLDVLRRCGLEIEDPTGARYPVGGEAMMRPLDFVPTDGLTYDRVTEATQPLVFWKGRLIQRAEVFVAVPRAVVDTEGGEPPVPGDQGDQGDSN